MNVLSFQSSVVLGHVGNAAATLPLQRLGHEVWAVDTVKLSNHPAHGGFRGGAVAPADARALVRGLAERGALEHCHAVVSGYLGRAAMGPVVLEAVALVKRANPRAVYLCDPVMGERGRGLYVEPGIARFFSGPALARADILMPNAFELALLSGGPCADLGAMRRAAEALLARGPRLVVAKGVETARGLGVLAVGREGAWLAETPRLEVGAHGAGDAFAAFFLGHYLGHPSVARALGRAVSAQHALMRATAKAGGTDLALVAAQASWMRPKTLFRARRLR